MPDAGGGLRASRRSSAGAIDAGHRNPSVDYTIFYDGDLSGVCGVADLTLRRPAGSRERQQQRSRLRRHLQAVLVHPHLAARERAQPGRRAVLAAELDRHRRPLQRARRHPLLRRRRRPQPDDGPLPGAARRDPLRLRLEHLLRLGARAGRVAREPLEHRLSRQPLHPLRRRHAGFPRRRSRRPRAPTDVRVRVERGADDVRVRRRRARRDPVVRAVRRHAGVRCAPRRSVGRPRAGRRPGPESRPDPGDALIHRRGDRVRGRRPRPRSPPVPPTGSGSGGGPRSTFAFGAGEPDAEFLCGLDKRPVASCVSPQTTSARSRAGTCSRSPRSTPPATPTPSPATDSFKVKRRR